MYVIEGTPPFVRARGSNGKEVLVPYYPNPDFVGREALLEQFQATLALYKSPLERENRRLALSGLGGIG